MQNSGEFGKRRFPMVLIYHNGIGAVDRAEGYESLFYALFAGQGYNFPGRGAGGRQNEEINV